MANDKKATFAFGSLSRLESAIASGKVNEYDLLLLEDDGVARIGWMSKDNEPVLISVPEDDVLLVDALPEAGELGVIYIMGEVAYLWTGTQFVVISESTDLTETKDKIAALEVKDTSLEERASSVEAQVSDLETEMATKVTAEEVATIIENSAIAVEVTEF